MSLRRQHSQQVMQSTMESNAQYDLREIGLGDKSDESSSGEEALSLRSTGGKTKTSEAYSGSSRSVSLGDPWSKAGKRESLGLRPEKTRTFGGVSDSDSLEDFSSDEQISEASSRESEEEYIVRPSRNVISRKRKRSPPASYLKEPSKTKKTEAGNQKKANKKTGSGNGTSEKKKNTGKTQRVQSNSSWSSGKRASSVDNLADEWWSSSESERFEEDQTSSWYESESNEVSGPVMEKIVAMRVVRLPLNDASNSVSSFTPRQNDAVNLSPRKHSFSREEDGNYKEETQYLIKWKNRSYIHCDWVTEDFILSQPQGKGRLQRFRKNFELNAWKRGDDDLRDDPDPIPEEWSKWTTVDRILAENLADDGVKEFLVKWCALPYSESTWETEDDIRDYSKIQEFYQRNKKPSAEFLRGSVKTRKPLNLDVSQISFKNGGFLREYQIEGLKWLVSCWCKYQGSILADEMGLGKTLQTVAFLQYLYVRERIRGPFLIIAPLSTVEHWKREFESWTDMNVVVYHGNSESRSIIHQYEWGFSDNPKGPPYKFIAIVTTYESIILDPGKLRSVEWEVMVVDEAHRLKNRQAKLVEELRSFSTKHRILLTGTPIQNSSAEVWALLNFLEPSKFSDENAFLSKFAEINDSETAENFREMLRPYMLRRQKEDVEKSIPPKEETIVSVELTRTQKKWYRATLEQNFSFLEKGAKSSNVGNLHNIFMELRKCCNHPYLIKGVELIETQHLGTSDDETHMQHLIEASGKLVLVDKLLPKLRESGHKVLIFSQMIRVLDILEDYLSWRRWGYERIDGRVRGIDRQQAIDRFCNPSSDKFVFLLCTRAGGQGINLTAADTVIIFDSDWNPQNDIQAQARCHRIGQEKDVKVYRLVTRGTYEEDMFERASKKLGLDQAILQDMGFEEGNKKKEKESLADIKKEEIDRLLKKGAYAVLNDDDTAADAFTAEDIDQILQRRTRLLKVGGDQPRAPSAFSKASFASEAPEAGKEELDLSDPHFWQKLMPSAAEKPLLEAFDDAQPRTRRQVQRYTMGEDVSSEEQEEESSDDVGYTASGSGGRKRFNKGDRVRIQRALLAHGWGRWSVIRKHAGLQERRTLNEVARYIRTFVRLLTKYGAEYACVSLNDVIKRFAASREAFKPHDFVPEESGQDEVANNSPAGQSQHMENENQSNTAEHLANKEKLVNNAMADGNNSNGTDKEHEAASKTPEEFLEEEFRSLEPVLADPEYQSYLQKIAWSNLERIQLIQDIRVLVEKGLLESNEPVPKLGTSGVHHIGSWWTSQFDRDLIRGTYKHGFGQYRAIKKDPELIFSKAIPLTVEEEESMDMDDAVCVPLPCLSTQNDAKNEGRNITEQVQDGSASKTEGSMEVTSANRGENEGEESPYWPTVQVLNARVKKLVRAYYRMLKRQERQRQQEEEMERQRQLRLDRNFVKPGYVGTGERTRYLKCVPVWSKKEKADFAKLYFNIGAPPMNTPEISCWQLIRRRAGLTRKAPDVVEQYAKEFSTMCGQVLVQAGDEEGYILNCLNIPDSELAGKFSPQELEDAKMTLVSARKFKERRKLVFGIRDVLLPKLGDQSFINTIVQCLSEARHDLQPWWNTELDVALAKGVAKHAFDLKMIVEDPNLILKQVLSEVYMDEQQKKASLGESGCTPPRSIQEVTEEQRLSVVPKERSLITRLWFMVELVTSSHPMESEHLTNRPRSGARAVTVTVDKRTVELVRFSPGGPIGGVIPHGFTRAPLEKLTRKLLRDIKNRKKTSESSVLDVTVNDWLLEKEGNAPLVKTTEDMQPLSNSVEVSTVPRDSEVKEEFLEPVSSSADISKGPSLSSPEGKSHSYQSSSKSVKDEKPRESKIHTIPRAEDGSFVMPVRMGVLTIESLGRIEPYRKGFHNERAIYPIGFRSRRHFTSMVDVERQCDYICEIIDSGDDYPLFRVTCEDLPGHVFEETSASGCWCRILKVIRERTPEERRRSHVSVSGPEYFGFVNPLVLEMIQELPGADLCERYKKRTFLPPGTIKKQRTGTSSQEHDSRDYSDSKDSASPVS